MTTFLYIDLAKQTGKAHGGERSMSALLRQLDLLGHDVMVLRGLDYSRVQKEIESRQPDVVLTAFGGAFRVCRLAEEVGVRSVLYVRNEAMLTEAPQVGPRSVVVCNSEYLRERLQALSIEAPIVHSIIDEDFDVEHVGVQHLTMINPTPSKGIDLFFDLADALPGERFLLVEGSWIVNYSAARLEAERRANVDWMNYVDDPREIYQQTEILLVPSMWKESDARVVWEAAASGVPSVVSDQGGLPESVGDGGIVVDVPTVEAWTRGIEQARSNYWELGAISKMRARERRELSAVIAKRFAEAVC